MPQVHPVAALANPHERLELQKARHPGVRHDQHGDEQGCEHRYQGNAAPIGERRVARRGRYYYNERREGSYSHHVECCASTSGLALGTAMAENGRGPDQGQESADEQAEGTRIGAVVNAARVS